MAGATTTTLSEAIQKAFLPEMTTTFYNSTPLWNLFGTTPSRGGNSIDFRYSYQANDSATSFSEGGTPPAAGNMEYADGTIAHQAYWSVVQITGHARDAMRGGYFDAISKEMQGGITALAYAVEQGLVTALEAAIDDSSTYAGQTRSTVGSTSDITAGGSAVPTAAVLSEMYQTLQLIASARAVMYDPNDHIILSAPEQATNYTELMGIIYSGDDETTGANLPMGFNAADTGIDIGKVAKTLTYNKIPWVTIPTLTNTNIMITRRSDVIIEVSRDITVQELGKIDDSDRFLISWNGALAHTDTLRAGKIETLIT